MENFNDMLIGHIHSFESFGAVDGPGLRFIVFMQGCSLRCKYCHNRDSWDLHSGLKYTANELIAKISRYKSYFEESNGGVTISGGEPLLQTPFLIELITKLKEQKIHVAIDTSGNFTLTDEIKKVIDLADMFLLDIKCINDEICKDLTGFSNKKTLEFAKYLSDINKPVWIRQVLVPTYTDNIDDLKDLKIFIDSLNNVEKIEILPYHNLGSFKWKELGKTYELEHLSPPTPESLNLSKEILGIK